MEVLRVAALPIECALFGATIISYFAESGQQPDCQRGAWAVKSNRTLGISPTSLPTPRAATRPPEVAMSNPFLLDDDTGFGILPPASNPAPKSAARDTSSSKSGFKSPSRAGSGHRLAPDEAPSDEKKSLLGAGSDSSAPGSALHDPPPEITAVNNDAQSGGARRRTTSWIFSLLFWQQYFDVDTEDVAVRIKNAIISPMSGTFRDVIGDNPDLWGPFWVCATLIFINALGTKYADYLTHDDSEGDFTFDVTRVSFGVCMFYGYAFCVPAGLWFILRCFGGVNTGLASLLCLYGYSLMVYVPMGILCLAPNQSLRWFAFLPSMAISSAFLFFNVRGVVAESPKGLAFATPFMGCVVGAHACFGLLLKLY